MNALAMTDMHAVDAAQRRIFCEVLLARVCEFAACSDPFNAYYSATSCAEVADEAEQEAVNAKIVGNGRGFLAVAAIRAAAIDAKLARLAAKSAAKSPTRSLIAAPLKKEKSDARPH
jgi:hypothetical protein